MAKERSPEEQADHQHEIMIRRKQKGLRTRIKNRCSEQGLVAIEAQYDWLKNHNGTELPVSELSHKETVIAWGEGIDLYKESITA